MDSIIKLFFWHDLNHTIVCGDHNLKQFDWVLLAYYAMPDSFSLDGRFQFRTFGRDVPESQRMPSFGCQ